MSSSFNSSDIIIDGIPIECGHHGSKKGFSCYSSVNVDGISYVINDPVLIADKEDCAVARIICIFVDKDDVLSALVNKHIFARNIEQIFYNHSLEFAEANEVVQDVNYNYVINVDQIRRQCALIIMHPDEDPSEVIENNNLNPASDFVCRFTLRSKKLIPLLTLVDTSNIMTRNGRTKRLGIESTPSTYIEEFKQPDLDKDSIFSPPQRNSVKRNLNKSFGDTKTDSNESILNYSIVDLTEDEDDNGRKPLVVKLRVSRKVSTMKENEAPDSPSLKRKVRQLPRKSYADYISPKKSTPTKRYHSYKIDSDEDVDNIKVAKSTPKKETLTKTLRSRGRTPKSKETVRSSGREVKAPLRYEDECQSPDSRVTTPRRVTRRNLSMDYNEATSPVIEKSVNLDDSIRTVMLKVHLKNLRIDPETVMFNAVSKDSKCDNSSESNVPQTPKGRRRTRRTTINSDTDSDNCPTSPRKTPRTRRACNTPKSQVAKSTPKCTSKSTPKTPRNVVKLMRDGIITPSMQTRSESVAGDSTPLMKARSQLHVSFLPKSLPCRETEYTNVYNFLEGKLLDGCGGCMYVSGVPGTGKTATVTSVINDLEKKKAIPEFTYVSVNGMRLTEPRQAYVEIVKQLVGKTVPWEQAQSMLDELFVKSKKLKPVVMLIDELDILCTKRQDVVYNLLDWPTKAKNQLIVVTIANTMDLPERLLMSRVTSRLGLTRLTFQAYTHKQLQEIVTERLCGTNSFNPDAVQFVARKVASVSGDARRALDICRRAAEIAELEGIGQLVNMNHVNEALNAMITQPKVRAIKNCSRLEQLILQSIVAEVERTGVEETNFSDVYKMLISCAAIDGFQMVSTTITLAMVAKLSACRLILTDQKSNDVHQRIILNVSSDDVYYALKKD